MIRRRRRISEIIAGLEQVLRALDAEDLASTSRDIALLRERFVQVRDAIRNADPIRQPDALFDPSDPGLLGRIMALAVDLTRAWKEVTHAGTGRSS